MRRFIFLGFALFMPRVAGYIRMISPDAQRARFEEFIHTNKKAYGIDSKEGQKRFHHFCATSDMIRRANQQLSSFKLGINQFADEDSVVLQRQLLSNHFSISTPIHRVTSHKPEDKLPTEINYVSTGKVSRVKNQGKCGSCWAFSTTGAVESRLRLLFNRSDHLSEQHLLDCSASNHGCDGGLMDRALDDINLMGGMYTEEDYPYLGQKDSCRLDYKKIVEGTRLLQYDFSRPCDVEDMKRKLVAHGPLCSAVEVDPLYFVFYQEGIFDREKPSHRLNHAVLLVGYDQSETDPKSHHWLIKNSWGESWGEKGYMRVALRGHGEGAAGIHLYGLYLH